MIYIRDDLQALFRGLDSVDDFVDLPTEPPVRALANRRTARFERDGRSFYIKVHRGIGWWEVFKNLLTLRLPVTGARNEWLAIKALEALNIDTMRIAAYGESGWNPAARTSFLVTEDLRQTCALDEWARQTLPGLGRAQGLRYKRELIRRVAEIARKLHAHGINHRDLYLCHFLLDIAAGDPPPDVSAMRVFLIDLHRVQIRARAPARWVIKDLAGLLFFVMYLTPGLTITSTDMARFIKAYAQTSLRDAVQSAPAQWRAVVRRIIRTHVHDYGTTAQLPAFMRAAL